MTGRWHVEGLALTSTELTKLCAQRACEQCPCAAYTHKHTLCKKNGKKIPKQLFQHVTAECKQEQEEAPDKQLACVSMIAAWAFSLRIEFSCPPEDDIRLAKIQKSSFSAHSCEKQVF